MKHRLPDQNPDGAAAPASAASRTDQRSTAREALVRRALAGVAGMGAVAAALALIAVPGSAEAKNKIHMPTAAAANAAFLTGYKAAAPMAAAAMPMSGVAVKIANYAFAPAKLTVSVGTTVTWTNEDTAPHTVTISSGPVKFSSPSLNKGDTFSYTFKTPGTYSYYCAVHPNMTATVLVTGSTPTSTPPTGTPTGTSSSPPMSMSMPAPSGNSTCAVSYALQTFLTHVDVAHLEESPGQQVNDILNINTYIGNHLALVENMLGPLTGGGLTTAVSSALQTLLTHVNSAHLGESPGQQVNDILDVDSYIGNHLTLVEHMLSDSEALAC